MDRLTTYFQHQAELISDEDGTATIVRVQATDCLYEYTTPVGDSFRGWLYDGESLADIDWKPEPAAGWPQNLR